MFGISIILVLLLLKRFRAPHSVPDICAMIFHATDFYSVLSEGSASDSDADNESQDGADVETDEDEGTYFDTHDMLSSDALRSASYRSREGIRSDCVNDGDFYFFILKEHILIHMIFCLQIL